MPSNITTTREIGLVASALILSVIYYFVFRRANEDPIITIFKAWLVVTILTIGFHWGNVLLRIIKRGTL